MCKCVFTLVSHSIQVEGTFLWLWHFDFNSANLSKMNESSEYHGVHAWLSWSLLFSLFKINVISLKCITVPLCQKASQKDAPENVSKQLSSLLLPPEGQVHLSKKTSPEPQPCPNSCNSANLQVLCCHLLHGISTLLKLLTFLQWGALFLGKQQPCGHLCALDKACGSEDGLGVPNHPRHSSRSPHYWEGLLPGE